MAADGGRSMPPHATQVCAICKARKKKCDKVLPSCGYCVRKGLHCSYFKAQPQNEQSPASSPPFHLFLSQLATEPATGEANLYRYVLQLIHETGQFVDDISTRYFKGLHRYLPICSRTRFYRNLITLGAVPSADFSGLLLAICLITTSGTLDRMAGAPERRPLYLATNSVLALVQEIYPSSICLIQSRLLLAVYEYTCGRSEIAFQNISGCARMAYAARIHFDCRSSSQKAVLSRTANMETSPDLDDQLYAEERANTWWGIVICERIFFCEVAVSEQPLLTTIPNGEVLLPIGPESLEPGNLPRLGVSSIKVSCIDSIKPGGFGRSAQASWLLDQVFEAFKIQDWTSRLVQLRDLDLQIQHFLSILMQQSYADGNVTDFCQAIVITIRAVFTIHSHILQQPGGLEANGRSVEYGRERSQAALDTAVKMVVDVAKAHENSDMVPPPSFPYIIRAALQHIYERTAWKSDRWLLGEEERLRTSLHRFNHGPNI